MKGRVKRLFDNLDQDVDAVAIINGMRVDPNFFYITGYTSGLFEFSQCYLFRDGRIEVITTPLEEEAAKQKDYVVHVVNPSDNIGDKIRQITKDVRKLAINFRNIAYSDYLAYTKHFPAEKIVDASEAIDKARRIKDPDELSAIKRACKIISKVADKVPQMLRANMTESELRAEIEYEIMKENASPSFPSIVAFGENSAIPHYSPGRRRLKKGDTVLVDIGARYNLYCSDLTRTYFYKQASRLQKEMYNVVKEAQQESIAAIKEGVKGKEVYHVAASIIDSSKFAGRFIHGLGHHLGLEVHDGYGRALSRNGEDHLQRGMVLTVEPGVYLAGKGGVRIEDDVVVGEKGAEVLTEADKELKIVD